MKTKIDGWKCPPLKIVLELERPNEIKNLYNILQELKLDKCYTVEAELIKIRTKLFDILY